MRFSLIRQLLGLTSCLLLAVGSQPAEGAEKPKTRLTLDVATAVHLSLAKVSVAPSIKVTYAGYLSRTVRPEDVRDYSSLKTTWNVTYSPEEDKGPLNPVLFTVTATTERRADSVFSFEADGTLLYLSVSIPGEKAVDDALFPAGTRGLSGWTARKLLTKRMGCRELK
jgi:hypothetical protein